MKDQTPNVQFLIDDEFEAIEGYKKAINQTDDPSIIKVLSHIMNEEIEHVSKLRHLLANKTNVDDSLKQLRGRTKMFTKDELKNLNMLSRKLRDERFEFAVYAKDPRNRDAEIDALNRKYPSVYVHIHGTEEICFESSNQNELQKIMNEMAKTYKISPWRNCEYSKKVQPTIDSIKDDNYIPAKDLRKGDRIKVINKTYEITNIITRSDGIAARAYSEQDDKFTSFYFTKKENVNYLGFNKNSPFRVSGGFAGNPR